MIDSATDGQKALCWITGARGFYYGSNTGSDNVAEFAVNTVGQPVFVGIAATTEAGTTDSVAADHGRFLYVQSGKAGTVDEFAVAQGGQLTQVGEVAVPLGAEGIAAVG